jgi:ketosteroid isomerase-like protein
MTEKRDDYKESEQAKRVEEKVEDKKEPGRVITERLWNAIATADIAELGRVISPRAVWRMPGRSPQAGTYEGLDEILGFMAIAGELSDELESNLLEIFTNERGAVLRYAIHATRGDRVLDIQHLFMVKIKDGLIVEGVFAPIDQERYDDFWLDRPAASEEVVAQPSDTPLRLVRTPES